LAKRISNGRYHRIGLVELLINSEDANSLFNNQNKTIKIGAVSQLESQVAKSIENIITPQYEAQIQVEPK